MERDDIRTTVTVVEDDDTPTKVVEEVSNELVVIDSLRTLKTRTVKKETLDPFKAPGPEVKKYAGIVDAQFKRKISNDIKKAYSGDGADSSRIDEKQITGYDIFGVIVPPYNLYAFAQLYELSAPHYAAVNAKVSNIVGLGYKFVLSKKSTRLLQSASDDSAKKQTAADYTHAQNTHAAVTAGEVPPPQPPQNNTKKLDKIRNGLDQHKDDLEDRLESFNDEDGFVETLTKVWRDYEVTGNGYLEVGRKSSGDIGYIGHIPSQTMRVRKDRDGFVQIVNGKAQFFANFGDSKKTSPFASQFKVNEIIHIKKYSPSHSFYGVPDIIAAQQAIAGNEYAAQFNLDYFENKAVPRHVITLTGAKLGPQAETDLLTFFETGLKGQNHRSIFIPLPPVGPDGKPPVLEFKPIEAGIQESSFKGYHDDNTDEILMVHRVPKTKVSVNVGASVALAADADKTFKEQVCAPEQDMFEVKLNKIVKELTDAYCLELNQMTLTDELTQATVNDIYLKDGVLTRNDVRDTLGKPNIDKGDEIIDMNAAATPPSAPSGTGQTAPNLKSDAGAVRQRDTIRATNASDTNGQPRNAKGEGRKTP